MDQRQEYENAVIHLQAKLDEALQDAEYWKRSYNEIFTDFTNVCDGLADLQAEKDEIEAKYGRLVWAVETDKDGDGFICKEAMDELLNEDDTIEESTK